MRPGYSRLTPALVHQQARQVLADCLSWQPWKRSVTVPEMLRLLLLLATTGRSLFAVVRRHFAFSHETASRAVKANLPDLDRLTAGLVRALHDVVTLSRLDLRRRWILAIDTHFVPYYGDPTPLVVGGPRKSGTRQFFGYATAVLLHRRCRYMVAFCVLTPNLKPHEIVGILLTQIAAKGLKIKGVALDSAFDSGDTLLLLQERRLAYTVPLRRKGRGDNARNRCFDGASGTIGWASWVTEDSRRTVRTRTVLWVGRSRTMVFAFAGWKSPHATRLIEQANVARQTYRDRYGIETSYRQKNQAQARTTSRDAVYRLLLEGLGYLLRQIWVADSAQLARSGYARADDWIEEFTLERVLEWLTAELKPHNPQHDAIPINHKCQGNFTR